MNFGVTITCLLVLQKSVRGVWLHLVHVPQAIPPVYTENNLKSERRDDSEDSEEQKKQKVPSQTIAFSGE